MNRSPRPSSDSVRAALEQALLKTGQGDREAFNALYHLTSAKLFGIIHRICGSQSAAEDVLSDAYLTIWRRAETYEAGRVSPVTWLATIARNKAIDWRRKASNRPQPNLDDVLEPKDDGMAADMMIEEQQADAQLERCLNALGEPGARYVRTAFYGGLTYGELAEREDVPLGTMKSRMRRALIALRDCMDDKE